MDSKNGAGRAPTIPEMEGCIRELAQFIEWHCHGCCRGFTERKPISNSAEATEMAKAMLDRLKNA